MNPKLVISYGFSNDIGLGLYYAKKGLPYPPGTPDSFDHLSKLVDDIRAHASFSISNLFPRTTGLLRRVVGKGEVTPRPASKEELLAAVDSAVDRFVWNQMIMRTIADGRKFRFITVLQPTLRAHKRVSARDRGDAQDWWLFEYAVQKIMATDYCRNNCLNYAGFFDSMFSEVPVLQIPNETRNLSSVVFADPVHLLDAGNEYIAQRLIKDLKP